MVSTVHNVTDFIERNRRRPRLTSTNKNHVKTVWGSDPVSKIKIPRMIDDYNHWMGGVDLADQRVAYYTPDMRCRRIWMPMMIQCLNIIRNNVFILFKELNNSENSKDLHKRVTLEIIESLRRRARVSFNSGRAIGRSETRSVIGSPSQSNTPKAKRVRVKSTNPTLDDRRLEKPLSINQPVIVNVQRSCRMCAHKRAMFLKNNPNEKQHAPTVRRPSRICNYCDVFLCSTHFDEYHSE